MENQNKHISGDNGTLDQSGPETPLDDTREFETPDQGGREIPFDDTTNFSLLGWLWDKFNIATSSKKQIDLKLEE
ncbi:hypothetical protein JY97_06295 [Alkalispirochaeta odontotermitis]|nr:hypothetical protein JY97_06295 [Alkalispirochaeta odontotermitis]